MIRECPYCNSIWVCWNWCHWDLEELIKLNPHRTREELSNCLWGHECWDCDNVHETAKKIHFGIPYWILKRFYWKLHKLKIMLEKLAQ